jgi:hypothetical protein
LNIAALNLLSIVSAYPETLFDSCDEIDNWHFSSTVKLTLDSSDKVEGNASLKGIYPAGVYGGMFYKEGEWNLTETPLMRMWVKINASIPGLIFEIITTENGNPSAWNSFRYEILNQLTIGEWSEVTIDLRQPNSTTLGKVPYLEQIEQFELFTWNLTTAPASINWDNITVSAGPYILPQAAISPSQASIGLGDSVTLYVSTVGGELPYSYSWFVNETLQQGQTSSSFTFQSSAVGIYNITCLVTDNVGNHTSTTAFVKVISLPLSPPTPPSSDLFKSEVRGMFVQPGWYIEQNWTLIAQTCKDYGINMIVIEVSLDYLWENGQPKFYSTLKTAIDAFHAYGFNVHLLIMPGNEWTLNPDMRAVDSQGNYVEYASLTKNVTRTILSTLCSYLAENYDFEGLMFDDCTGYNGDDIDYSEEARQEFIRETGLTDVNWPSDVVQGGRYWYQFAEWRADEVTEFVELIESAVKAKKPNCVFSAAVFAPYGSSSQWGDWALYYGQHVTDWIDRGLLDFVCPMIGTRTLYGFDSVDERCRNVLQYFVGKREGKIPVIPFTCYTLESDPRPIDNWVQAVQIMRSYGLDGWIIWRYGGPGWNRPGYSDIRPYLTALADAGLLEPVWAIQNFNVEIKGNYATISWTTTVPTNATIEYANGKIFYASIIGTNFHHKDIDYNGTDSTKISNSTWSTFHSFTIPITQPTSFRISSTDEDGNFTTTSKDYSITEEFHIPAPAPAPTPTPTPTPAPTPTPQPTITPPTIPIWLILPMIACIAVISYIIVKRR